MKDTIFISHATPTDNIFATWLATKLELCGYKVWVCLLYTSGFARVVGHGVFIYRKPRKRSAVEV